MAGAGNVDLAGRKIEYAEQHGLAEPQTAWLATAFAAMFTGDHRVALDAAERSLAAADARGDEDVAVTASTVNRWENSHAEPSKLAWKAIRELGKTRGLQVSEALGAD